ncbi:MBL fold metallo-hydrolase [Pseudonocardia sp. CA-107938]|uniref:MBL fold metallo-hydrolase n=1 Tax=Pseudonocardia sp. CA-107938 TaxID=3240021 RepID=UPI003D8DD461
MKIADGLHRIGSDIINCYLVVTDDGVTVIDAGLPGYWRYLEAELHGLGRTLRDVRALILTHGDGDHIGFAARMHRELGIAAHIHEADVPRARLEITKPYSGWGPVKAGPAARFIWYSVRHGGLRIPPATGLQTFTGDQQLDVPGTPRLIHVPGHTPGSVAVHVPAVDALFLGDIFTTRHVMTGARGPQPAPFTIDPEQAATSLLRLADVDATWVLPGHGPAWDGGAAEAVRLIGQAAAR